MGREVRRVPLDWQHPTDERGRYQPLYDNDYDTAAREWLDELMAWEVGTHPDRQKAEEQYGARYFWDWHGDPPDKDSYRERAWTAEEATGYQFYETVSDGTPLSPVFATQEELVAWLVTNKGYSERAVRLFVERGWAPLMIIDAGGLHDGIEGLAMIVSD